MVQKHHRILLVDDEALVRHTIEAGLRPNGYEVLHAGDGDEALDVLSACFKDRPVVPIYARDLVLGLGTLHCSTMQEPR